MRKVKQVYLQAFTKLNVPSKRVSDCYKAFHLFKKARRTVPKYYDAFRAPAFSPFNRDRTVQVTFQQDNNSKGKGLQNLGT